MGGSSSKQREEQRKREEEARLEVERKRREEEAARRKAEAERLREQLRQLEIERLQRERILLEKIALERRQRERAEALHLARLKKHKVRRNLDLLNDFREVFNLTSLSSYPDKPYIETHLPENSRDYLQASIVFKTSNKRFFTISKITKIDNTFHVLQYLMMKDKYLNCYDEPSLSEMLIFHGTKREFLQSICTYNFDRSKVRNHKFGHGISFARDAYYATHYHRDDQRNYHKVMIITQMFWGRLDLGTEDTIVPNSSYTSANADKSVIVKYDDASFYPLYIVHYDGLHSMKYERDGLLFT